MLFNEIVKQVKKMADELEQFAKIENEKVLSNDEYLNDVFDLLMENLQMDKEEVIKAAKLIK